MICLHLAGAGVERLRHESGGHRVQRVPRSERRGRVHSSTVTVAVLDPGARRTAAAFDRREPGDFVVSYYSGTGPGGQNRNKVQASARVVHTPTGLVRTAQTRSRENSTRLAMAALEAALDEAKARARMQDLRQDRAGQVGRGERADKRRTYRFQEDRVVDHLTGRAARAGDILNGAFMALWPDAGQGAE